MHRTERGNILFLILLAVILFAALSYAVTSSVRGGGKDASSEKLQSQAAQLQNYGVQLRTALQRMRLVGGYELWQIDYSKTGTSFSTANATCTSTACKLFDPGGGNVTPFTLPTNMTETSGCSGNPGWAGRHYFNNATVVGVGIDTERDLLLAYPGVNRWLCAAVNNLNGVANQSSGLPYTDALGNDGDAYSGTLTQDVTLSDSVRLGDATSVFSGKQMFCVREHTSCYTIYFVLHER